MASYPTSVRVFSTKVDQVDVNFAAHINDLQGEVVAIQTELGTLPKGSLPTVKARLDGVDSGKANTVHTHVTSSITDIASADHSPQYFNTARHTLAVHLALGLLDSTAHGNLDHSSVAGIGSAVPTGTVVMFGPGTIPGGWLELNGQGVSTTQYAALFALYGYGFGGSGSTFNLPNMCGRSPVGAGTGAQDGTSGTGVITGGTALTTRTVGQYFGKQSETISTAQMPVHSHTGATQTSSHTHTASSSTDGAHNHPGSGTGVESNAHNHIAYSGSISGYGNGNNVGVIINSNAGGTNVPQYTESTETAQHTHVVANSTDGAHAHTVSVVSNTHSHPITAEGSGAALNNVQPSLVLRFLVKT